MTDQQLLDTAVAALRQLLDRRAMAHYGQPSVLALSPRDQMVLVIEARTDLAIALRHRMYEESGEED